MGSPHRPSATRLCTWWEVKYLISMHSSALSVRSQNFHNSLQFKSLAHFCLPSSYSLPQRLHCNRNSISRFRLPKRFCQLVHQNCPMYNTANTLVSFKFLELIYGTLGYRQPKEILLSAVPSAYGTFVPIGTRLPHSILGKEGQLFGRKLIFRKNLPRWSVMQERILCSRCPIMAQVL